MSRRFWTEDKIVAEIKRLNAQGEDLWYRAMERSHKDLIRASERYFKGWKNAIIAAGLDYDLIKKRSHQVWTEDKILEKLFELKSQGVNLKPSIVQQHDKKLYHAAIRHYGKFNNVISSLNLKYGYKVQGATERAPKAAVSASPRPKKTIVNDLVPGHEQEQETLSQNMKIFTVRTRMRSERNVGETILKRAESKNLNIGNIQYPTALNGYIFVECDNREGLEKLIKNVRNAQGLLNGETTPSEISQYLGPQKSKKRIVEGTRVEITEGQFKGEHAVVQRVNERSKALTVELLDEVVKMPITIYLSQCKILN